MDKRKLTSWVLIIIHLVLGLLVLEIYSLVLQDFTHFYPWGLLIAVVFITEINPLFLFVSISCLFSLVAFIRQVRKSHLVFYLLFAFLWYPLSHAINQYQQFKFIQTKEDLNNLSVAIQTKNKDFFKIEQVTQVVPKTTNRKVSITLTPYKANFDSKYSGQFMLEVQGNLSRDPMYKQLITIQPSATGMIDPGSEVLQSDGTTTLTFLNNGNLVLEFYYDDSGPAEDLTAITISLTGYTQGSLNGLTFYKKIIHLPR